ncbi:DNA-binding response regulator [Mesobaculum littorinae]|uniref:DNA-binding response regulator n=1 Tax=Mesobaculum littorinae TaxID=2486419 RepID=A0A438AEB3_9RHOB|nr:DNA-binding response regulator [Mesobaculum littorinae]RVV97041.1 DNA-binding response regulator [Mesobaculum littorinae]
MTAPDARIASVALIVDDDPGSVGMVTSALEDSGTTVLVARDGLRALELLGRIDPDVILLDAVMPGLDGFETCRRMKSAPVMTEAPIIFMTGLSGSDDLRRGLAAGGVDYVTKPVRVDELIARVTTHILNARQVRDLRAAFDTQDRSVLAAAPDGTLAWASPKALERLERVRALGADGRLAGAALLRWIAGLREMAVSSAPIFELGDAAMRYTGRTGEGHLLVRIDAADARAPIDRLTERFALTTREAEVLVWLAQGKANRDIAEILTLSARTVNKHLEQVFQKLGVDNRTAAALMADRILSARA